MTDDGIKRMVVEMTTPFHTRIKVKAAKHRISLRRLVIMLLERWLLEQDALPADNPLHMPEQKTEPPPIRLTEIVRQ